MDRFIVFTDLDGTLLDSVTYSWEAAADALHLLRARQIPLVLTSSKTRAEIEPIRSHLQNQYPFIVENGGAIYTPKGLFPFPLEGAAVRGPYQIIELGTPYPRLRAALKEIEGALGVPLRGFGDMPAEEVAERTGLAHPESILAKQREYDEPFLIEGDASILGALTRQAEARGLHCMTGGRFYHLAGDSDKGKACQILTECYRRLSTGKAPVTTVGLGDQPNDLPMLVAVDRPILVQLPTGSYHPGVSLPNLVRATGIGPAGWNQAILELLRGA
ncbi:MAG: HAD-IIB family hydrolase [Nitrospiraceae bacterium]